MQPVHEEIEMWGFRPFGKPPKICGYLGLTDRLGNLATGMTQEFSRAERSASFEVMRRTMEIRQAENRPEKLRKNTTVGKLYMLDDASISEQLGFKPVQGVFRFYAGSSYIELQRPEVVKHPKLGATWQRAAVGSSVKLKRLFSNAYQKHGELENFCR